MFVSAVAFWVHAMVCFLSQWLLGAARRFVSRHGFSVSTKGPRYVCFLLLAQPFGVTHYFVLVAVAFFFAHRFLPLCSL